MKTFTTDAINIKSYPLSDNDKIIVMLSREKGLIKGVAKGASNPKSKLGARMQMLVANKLMLNVGKNLDTIKEAQAINPFSRLRKDLDKLTYSLYLSEIITNFCKENMQDGTSSSSEIYDILYTSLSNIACAENKTQVFLAVLRFQLKFMKSIGFGLELENCLICSNKVEQNAVFSIPHGGIVCPSCARAGLLQVQMHTKIKEFLLALLTGNIEEKTTYDALATEKVAETCFELLKKYIDAHSSTQSKVSKVLEITKVS